MNCLAVIPARYASTRLPGKPLLPLAGKPIIQHVYERTAAAGGIDAVIVATDDERIRDCVAGFGGQVCMTSPAHRSGSDRVAEVAAKHPSRWVLNVQGDEPFIAPEMLREMIRCAGESGDHPPLVITAASPIRSAEEWLSPAVVKVVVGGNRRALYFSRWPIPYYRDLLGSRPTWGELNNAAEELVVRFPYRRHNGVYLYPSGLLQQFVRWPPGLLEQTEQLEQLRILENGYSLLVIDVPESPPGIDTLEDYENACRAKASAQGSA